MRAPPSNLASASTAHFSALSKPPWYALSHRQHNHTLSEDAEELSHISNFFILPAGGRQPRFVCADRSASPFGGVGERTGKAFTARFGLLARERFNMPHNVAPSIIEGIFFQRILARNLPAGRPKWGAHKALLHAPSSGRHGHSSQPMSSALGRPVGPGLVMLFLQSLDKGREALPRAIMVLFIGLQRVFTTKETEPLPFQRPASPFFSITKR